MCYITLNNLQEDSKCLFSLLCAELCHRYWGVDRKMLKLLPHLAKEEEEKKSLTNGIEVLIFILSAILHVTQESCSEQNAIWWNSGESFSRKKMELCGSL